MVVLCSNRVPMSRSGALQVLGLTEKEAEDERAVKRAYRRLALRHHPDVTQNADSADLFLKVRSKGDLQACAFQLGWDERD